jgi:hypothetical protein
MRQSDGADLLGTNHPRSADIGLIYVAPDDDRQSVLAAILTQEKLGRQQIAIVLPEQSKAFSRSVDFDGLKEMRRELQAQLIFIVPSGSLPAELARQRRFPVYPSLEYYAQELQDEDQTNEGSKSKGPLFRRSKRSEPPPVAPHEELPPSHPVSPVVPPEVSSSEQQSSEVQPEQPPDDDDNEQVFPLVSQQGPAQGNDDITQSIHHVVSESKQEDQPQPGGEGSSMVPVSSGNPANLPIPAGSVTPSLSPVINLGQNPYLTHKDRRGWLLAIPIVLLLLLIGFFVYRPLLDLIFVPSATVTITPVSKDLKKIYAITALQNPDPLQRQVQARFLYAASPVQSQMVNATGTGTTPGAQAIGQLTFYNEQVRPQLLPAGTVIVDAKGVQIVTDTDITIPGSNPPSLGQSQVMAHAVAAGTNGNIPALDFNNVPCCMPGILVSNPNGFGGGQDSQNYTYVQQSDIDNATSALASTLTAKTLPLVQKQVRAGEQLVSSSSCSPDITSDHSAGDRATTFNVSVMVICTGAVYNRDEADMLAANLLKSDPALYPGANFVPVGNIVTTVRNAILNANGTISLQVFAEGIWAYQFSDAQLHTLIRLIAGKTQSEANSLLKNQAGVNKITIQLYGGDGHTLPTDTSHITLSILSVTGLRGNTALSILRLMT